MQDNLKQYLSNHYQGCYSCGKLLPLRWAPITIKLDIVQNATGPIRSVDDVALSINVSGASGVNGGTVNTSQTWQIENPQIKVDLM